MFFVLRTTQKVGSKARLSTGKKLGNRPTSSSMILDKVKAKIMVSGKKLRNLTSLSGKPFYESRQMGEPAETKSPQPQLE